VDSLSTHTLELKLENTSLQLDISSLKNKALILKSGEAKSTAPTTDQLPQLLQELSDRDKCSLNGIIHGLIESTTTVSVDRNTNRVSFIVSTTNGTRSRNQYTQSPTTLAKN